MNGRSAALKPGNRISSQEPPVEKKYLFTNSDLKRLILPLIVEQILAVVLGAGAVGVWCAMVLDWIVRVFWFVGRYRSGKWKNFYHTV